MRNNSGNDNSKNKNQRLNTNLNNLNSDSSSRVTRNLEDQTSSLVSSSSSSLSDIKQSIGNLPTSSAPAATALLGGAREARMGGNGAALGAWPSGSGLRQPEGQPRKVSSNAFAPGGQAKTFGFQPRFSGFAQGPTGKNQSVPQKISKNFNQGKGSNQNKFQQLQQPMRRRVLSITQILAKYRKKQSRKKRQKQLIRPLIPPKSLLVMTTFLKAEKSVFNRRIIDYKNAGLLQKYIGIGGKILPRLQTGLTSKQQRYVAKTIKSARIMGLLPFVGKERGFFR
uniref:Small ribosomal subunit protein bS18c n=1 Tax=Staurocarteria crucifera TaxID=47781 RepID=A0A0S2IC79_9CHLO|nr:ribosomal protein S18 [Carteria crucifera]